MGTLAELQNELAEYEDALNACNEVLAIEPTDAESLENKQFFEEQIASVKARIAKLNLANQGAAATALLPPPPSPPPASDGNAPPPPPKYDMSKHPKFQKQHAVPPPPPEDTQPQQLNFNVRDSVMAKWSEDKQWYPATVVSKTGSSTDPVYTVTFKGYGNTETKRKHEIRAATVPESKKRKADDSPAVTTRGKLTDPSAAEPSAENSGGSHVISAAPTANASRVPPKREPSKVSDGPTRMAPEPKKLKGQKQLAKNQEGWKAFQASGPKKTGFGLPKQKESMFRTPDNPNAKVGFTGSGKGMQKDPTINRWRYKETDEED